MRKVSQVVWCTLLFCCGQAFAGRPVVSNLTLVQLAGASDVIALVDKPAGFHHETQVEPDGCTSTRWPLKVARILKQRGQRPGHEPIKEGAAISVVVNTIELTDCTIRSTNPNGESFMAQSYSQGPTFTLAGQPDRFIVFLRFAGNRLEVAAMNAFEASSRQDEIAALIDRVKDSR